MSLFRYPGSKAKIAELILRQLDVGEEFHDVFVGGGSVLCAVARQYRKTRMFANDIDQTVAAFWDFIADPKDDLMCFYGLLARKPTVVLFEHLRQTPAKSRVELAYRAVFFNRTTFSGIATSGPIGGYAQKSKWTVDCRYNHQELKREVTELIDLFRGRLTVTCRHFRDYLPGVPDTACLYLDPPYFVKGHEMYPHSMDEAEHRELVELLRSRGRWVLSYDVCDPIAQMYSWADAQSIDHRYCISGQGRKSWNAAKEYIILPPCEVQPVVATSGIPGAPDVDVAQPAVAASVMVKTLDDYPYTKAVLEGRERWALVDQDSAQFLKLLPDNCIDSIVCDPPAGIGFMAKEWDDYGRVVHGKVRSSDPDKNTKGILAGYGRGGKHEDRMKHTARSRVGFINFLIPIMRECLRVLKPGGHALVWALPRTSGWTSWALEDAGFEVRDCVYHGFYSGFPKSLDVSKAIDKAAGAERPLVGTKHVTCVLNPEDVNNYSVGTVAQGGEVAVTAPATLKAAQWEGFGTALKPSVEVWWLVRKSFNDTVAGNVLTYGTGALNIDECRITTGDKLTRKLGKTTTSPSGWQSVNRSPVAGKDGARWPSHLIVGHSEECEPDSCAPDCPTRMLGNASRFFFTPKPSRREREAGCESLPARSGAEAVDREEGSAGTRSPRAGAGRTASEVHNHHPTTKSISLMRYLCRLVTPPGGIVLDPFTGSGTTGCGAILEGFRFVGCEREPEYVAIASARITYWEQQALAGTVDDEPGEGVEDACPV
jgi:site-specific DNA-methyltransferase (adenine-specific)